MVDTDDLSFLRSLNLSTRAFNVLKNDNVRSLSDLLKVRESDLRRAPNCGEMTIREIKEAITRIPDIENLKRDFEIAEVSPYAIAAGVDVAWKFGIGDIPNIERALAEIYVAMNAWSLARNERTDFDVLIAEIASLSELAENAVKAATRVKAKVEKCGEITKRKADTIPTKCT